LWAEFPTIVDQESGRLAKNQLDAQGRGLGDEFAFAMYANTYSENLRARGEWLWQIMTTLEPDPNEDREQLTLELKRTVRAFLGQDGSDIPAIHLYTQRHGLELSISRSIAADVCHRRDTVLRELDSRLDGFAYQFAARARAAQETQAATQAPRLQDALISREKRKLDTRKRRDSWNTEAAALTADGKTRKEAAEEISGGELGLRPDGKRRYKASYILRQLKPKRRPD